MTAIPSSPSATERRCFEDPTGFARIDGQPALALEVKKRSGANVIDTVADVQETIRVMRADRPESVEETCLQDPSAQVQTLLSDP